MLTRRYSVCSKQIPRCNRLVSRLLCRPVGKCRLLSKVDAPELVSRLDTIIFDCDGVLWRGNDVIYNAPEALRLLRQAGKRVLFVTNNSTKSRHAYVERFKRLGIQASAEEIVSSSFMAAAYLDSIGFAKKAFLIGTAGVEEELKQHGIDFIGGEQLHLPELHTVDSIKGVQVDPDIGAVVVGWDGKFNYDKLVYASICLRELPGCLFVATNMDACDNMGLGRMMPGTGPLVQAVAGASGVDPINVGKGGPWLLPFLCKRYDLDPGRTCIVGDRLDTDIALGKQGGLHTVLTLTGVATASDAAAADSLSAPDFIINSIAVLAGLPTVQEPALAPAALAQ